MTTIKAQVSGYNGEYDGQSHNITVTPDVNDADIKYSLTSDGIYSTELPEKKDVGTYTVYYRVEKEGYYPSCGVATITISPKPVTVKWNDTTFTYDGTEKMPTAVLEGVLDGETCNVTVHADGTAAAVNAGSYGATATIDNDNYVINSGAYTTFTIERADRSAPELTTTAETISGKKDGKINGLTDEMEYRKITPATAGVASAFMSNSYTSVDYQEMSFESGTYAVRYKKNNNYQASADTVVTVNEGRKLVISLPDEAEQNGYTITCDKTQVNWMDEVQLTLTLKQGYTKTQDLAVMVNGVPVYASDDNGIFKIENIEDDQTVTVTGVADTTFPTGEIKLGETNSWKDFLHHITFNLFFKERQHVTISAADKGSGVKKVEYYLYTPTADKNELDSSEVATISDWKEGTDFDIDPDAKCVIYVKITDNADNVTYLSSDGIILDKTAPVIAGITDGNSYCQNLDFTVSDENIKSVTYQVDDGNIVDLTVSSDGKYTLPVADIVGDHDTKEIIVTATDMADNATIVKIKAEHEYNRTTVVAPTVLYKGYTMHSCTHVRNGVTCGKTYNDNYVDAVGVSGLVPNDKEDLTHIKDAAQERLNDKDEPLSEEDKAFYEEVLKEVSSMLDNVQKAEESKKTIDDMKISDITNPTADDSNKLNEALTKINELLDSDNTETPTQSLTDAQKKELESLRDSLNEKLNTITKVSDGLTEIKEGTPTDPGVDDINKIENIQPADQEKIEVVLSKIEEFLDNYESNLTEEQKKTVEDEYQQILDKLKDAAQKEVDQKLETIRKQIESSIFDPQEKATALSKAEEEAAKTKEALQNGTTMEEVVAKREDGKQKLEEITGNADDFKDAVKKNIERIFEEKKNRIEGMTDLTEKEKTEALKALEKDKQSTYEALENKNSKDDIINSYDDINSKFDEIVDKSVENDLSNAKEKAKEEINKRAEEAKKVIDSMDDLTEAEKEAAKAEIDKKAKEAKDSVENITDSSKKADIKSQQENVTEEIRKQQDDSSAKNESNAKENAVKAEEAIKKTAEVVEDIKVNATDKEAIKKEVEEELKKSNLDNVNVDVNEFKKIPAKLHESGKITGTVEIKVGGTTKTVEIDKELPKLSSFVNYESTVADDVPKAEISVDENTLMDKVLGEKEIDVLSNGGNADILLHVQNKNIKSDDKDVELIAAKLSDQDKVGKYFDISLCLNVVDANGTPIVENEMIHEADTVFTIKVSVPKELIATGRTFQIVRVHDGKAEILESVYDENENTLTFKTDRFSTYAITYSDTEQKTDITGVTTSKEDNSSMGTDNIAASVTKPNKLSNENRKIVESPKTGDNSTVWLFIIMLFAGTGITVFGRKKKVNR